ncbi:MULTISPECIES: GerAB/ArcD/ProY family transporter [unclassified Paenibacillus]|uniref:GerAB/ArcD/ProY family transporter n=1 Tax=unclassified Paenibacillus TaxID=185978 RepID=UPI00096F7DD8|nr:endospore germination permease [Paenibacillus sp. FSL H8-0259]OMF26870.1 spore gernimation protein [Paenibacillus sp. FSL H8-0259]
MNKITSYQLFTITFIFQLGTTIIFGFGGTAGRDAWIGELISSALGVVIILVYTTLMGMNPGLSLVQWFPAQFGRWIGTPIAFVYPLVFLYFVGRIIADIRDMVSTTLLNNTPLILITGLFALIIAFCLYGGAQIIARLGELFLPIVIIIFSIEIILLFGSGVMHIKNIQPVLENGWGPIWNVVYPGGVTQSFGEAIVLAMFWPEVKTPSKVMKITVISTVLSGIMIACLDLFAISVFGGVFSRFLYPLYTLLSLISIGKFIENLQMFGVLYFLMTALLKSVIYMFGALKGIQQLTKMKSYRSLIIPSCLLSLILGMTMSKNITEHIYYHHFKILLPYVSVPLHLVLPAILLTVTWFRQFKK